MAPDEAAPTTGGSCEGWAAWYGVGNGVSCDVETVRAHIACDEACKADPEALQRQCQTTCNTCYTELADTGQVMGQMGNTGMWWMGILLIGHLALSFIWFHQPPQPAQF